MTVYEMVDSGGSSRAATTRTSSNASSGASASITPTSSTSTSRFRSAPTGTGAAPASWCPTARFGGGRRATRRGSPNGSSGRRDGRRKSFAERHVQPLPAREPTQKKCPASAGPYSSKASPRRRLKGASWPRGRRCPGDARGPPLQRAEELVTDSLLGILDNVVDYIRVPGRPRSSKFPTRPTCREEVVLRGVGRQPRRCRYDSFG